MFSQCSLYFLNTYLMMGLFKVATVEFGPPNFSVFCCYLTDGFLYVAQLNPLSELNDMAVVKVTMVTVIMNCYS